MAAYFFDSSALVKRYVAEIGSASQWSMTHGMRAYDAIQLAAVLVIHFRRTSRKLSPLTLAASDQELLIAARAEGLLVEDPQTHP